jgi:hypothetical protein
MCAAHMEGGNVPRIIHFLLHFSMYYSSCRRMVQSVAQSRGHEEVKKSPYPLPSSALNCD